MRLSVVICGLLAAAVAAAQAPAPATTGVISGVVIDAVTQRPVRKAIVSLLTAEVRPQEAVAWTDAEGRFAFGYLPSGNYRLGAFRPGYQYSAWGSEGPRTRGKLLTLAAGENKANLTIKLMIASSISGTVTDEDGDPVAGVQVNLYMPVTQRGKRTVQQMNGAMTDSHGRYRISNVFAGEFFVAADTESEAAKGKAEVTVGQPQEKYIYAQQFYPGTPDYRAATTVKVAPGKEVEGINFRLQALPMATLLVHVAGAGEIDTSTADVTLVSDSATGHRGYRSMTVGPPDFTFRMAGLRPGMYKAVAHASAHGKEYRGIQEIQLIRETDVTVPLEPTVELSGAVTIEGPDAGKYSISQVSLSPGDQLPNSRPLRAAVGKDGTFKFPAVLPGAWDIGANPIPPGGYIKSMHLGDQDVLREEMVIHSSTAAPLKIVVSTAGAVVEGDVEGGEPGTLYAILLAPAGKAEDLESLRHSTQTDDKGHYQLKGISPGKYQLWAFAPMPMQAGLDVKAFEAEAVNVELKEGQKLTQNLKPTMPGGQNQ